MFPYFANANRSLRDRPPVLPVGHAELMELIHLASSCFSSPESSLGAPAACAGTSNPVPVSLPMCDGHGCEEQEWALSSTGS